VRNVQAGGDAMHGGMVEATWLEVRGQVNIARKLKAHGKSPFLFWGPGRSN